MEAKTSRDELRETVVLPMFSANPSMEDEKNGADQLDGGSKAWLTLCGSFIVVFCTSGYVNSFGVYEDFYTREYLTHFSSSKINWISGAQTFCLFSTGLFSGYAMDIGYFRHIMATGSILFVFCLFMISFTQPEKWYQLFLAQGIGLGLGIGSTYIPALSVVAQHFKYRRSLSMGIVASASSVGGIVHPIMLNHLFHSSVGFHWGVRISAFFNLFLLAIANLMMKTRLPPQDKSLWGIFEQGRHFLADKVYLIATSGTFLLITGVFFPTYFLQLDSIEHGISPTLAFYVIAILNGSSAFGRVLPTLAVRKAGVFPLIVFFTFATGILNFTIVAVHDAVGAIIMAILVGFASGACISLLGPMLAELALNVSEIGTRVGICFGVGGLGSLIGPPISGALLTTSMHWVRPAVFNGVVMCVGAFLLAIAGYLQRRARIGNM